MKMEAVVPVGSVVTFVHDDTSPNRHFLWTVLLQEMCQRPKFIAGDNSGSGAAADCGRLEVEAGELGDPWLLAAISSLTLTPRFLDRVIPPDQNFDPATYCGLFRYNAEYFFAQSRKI
jgi:hypothetical protein